MATCWSPYIRDGMHQPASGLWPKVTAPERMPLTMKVNRVVRDFYPLDYLPEGVRLTAYRGDAADLPPQVLQGFLDAVAAGTAEIPAGRVYQFDQIVEAHADMEQNRARGKLVVTT
jgi:NADPH:quinone reductase-like Zn-dependent oxidoreductase